MFVLKVMKILIDFIRTYCSLKTLELGFISIAVAFFRDPIVAGFPLHQLVNTFLHVSDVFFSSNLTTHTLLLLSVH